MDFSGLIDSFQRGLSGIPSIAIALALLAGPTVALIGFRLIVVARRATASSAVEIAPLWVCQSCRSVNELRLSRCYRCAAERDSTDVIEVIQDDPAGRPVMVPIPAGSPFASLAVNPDGATGGGPGSPVMAEPSLARDPIPVGPGRAMEAEAAPTRVAPRRSASAPVASRRAASTKVPPRPTASRG